MRLHDLVRKEFSQRLVPMLTCFLAVTLGVTALVAIQNITESSERKVAGQLENLGANVLVLPPSANLQDYYSADMNGETIPEEYVARIALAKMVGVEDLSPRLCVKTKLDEHAVVLTGILPRSEFLKKASWQSVGLLADGLDLNPVGSKHQGCSKSCTPRVLEDEDLHSFATTRVVPDLADDALLVGADLARRHGLEEGESLDLMGMTFEIVAVLPSTGTIDDGRLFAHLHTVQRIADVGPVVNVIEIMGCCEDAAGGLITDLGSVLPDAKVVTISRVVETQVAVNRLMERLAYVLYAILIVVGGTSIASVMYANVSERRRELGTLMALGATPRTLARLILTKAFVLGLAGGLCGLALGSGLAVILGPRLLDVAVRPSLTSGLAAFAAAVVVALIASYLPARRAATLDPCVCFQDV
jgi:putative ABC transport system permease protein